jgi:hypothetical protein
MKTLMMGSNVSTHSGRSDSLERENNRFNEYPHNPNICTVMILFVARVNSAR